MRSQIRPLLVKIWIPTKFALKNAEQKNENEKVILFTLVISSFVGIINHVALKPPYLASEKEILNNPDSMKVVS
tara:strand:- start:497 stop:718 length:222 start_codon:yes stop_codon:yes gene_type:complete